MGYTYQKYPDGFRTSINGRPDKLYMVWYDMHKRCKEGARDARWYFDKGVVVCDAWSYWPTFATWAREKGWRPGLEIDRRDGKLGYGPDNCRLVTEKEQVANRDKALVAISGSRAQRAVHSRKFVCAETGEVFSNHCEASEKTGIKAPQIGAALRGENKSAGGFQWRYCEQLNLKNEEALVNTQREYASG